MRADERIISVLTIERMDKYLAETNGDRGKALDLYEYNTRLAESFYLPLQNLEICFRNAIDVTMTKKFGENWIISQNVKYLPSMREKMRSAQMKIGELNQAPHGKLVAELSFGFWTELLIKRLETAFWVPAIHKVFSASQAGKMRSEVYNRFDKLRNFRNRVMHHEPVFHQDCKKLHNEINEAIGWIDKDFGEWTKATSRVESVLLQSFDF